MRRVRLYDTRSRETRLFVPLTPPKVGLFMCGLTPYASAHIGHGKPAVTFDVLTRALRRWGYRVFYVQNVTNVDDRLIQRGGEEGVDPLALADRHFKDWRAAMERLGVHSVNYYPYATDYVPEIIGQVRQLIDRGFAYPVGGSVYYSVHKFPDYGKLSGQRTEALRPGARVAVETEKQAPEDFVLWKAATPGEPWWESPWGPGRPGWHIEDTAITVRLFGPRYDIHGGATDLIFPHHEAEIAQAEGATGEAPLVNFWMHVGLLTMKGEKMSKSLGNVYGLDEAMEAVGPEVVRLFYLNAQYRSPLDFDPVRSLPEAREAYARLRGPALHLAERSRESPEGSETLASEIENASVAMVDRLDALLADDFQTREAISELFQWGRVVNEQLPHVPALDGDGREALAAPFRWTAEVLGLLTDLGAERAPAEAVGPSLAARARARARGDYAEADRIRTELRAAGIVLEDDASGTRWHRASPGEP
ncbi:MAG: cysteine--tRNA ligase [Thermoplasmata archaeon]|nr:cysteine--tRNA ligase [Thermoplasmata archaeon]